MGRKELTIAVLTNDENFEEKKMLGRKLLAMMI
jgi:hypothetical protein